MVPPTGLAETVTPPSFSPAADVTAPLRTASACARAGMLTAAATMANRQFRVRFMGSSPVVLVSSTLAGCRDRLEVRDNRIDLRRLEMILEARHAGRAVGDG